MNKNTITKSNIIPAIIAILHCIITFFTDKAIFSALSYGIRELPSDKLTNYILCKLILLVLLYSIYHLAYNIIFSKDRLKLPIVQIIINALPYLIVLGAVLIFKLPQGFLSNDESLIFAEASSLNSYTWFYYLTTYYYSVSMMLIPAWFGPIIVKVLIQFLTCGYVVYRMKRYTNNNRISYIMYLPFLLPPVLAYTTSAHRIPVYYLLYLLIFYILIMDMLEEIVPSKFHIFLILLLAAVLTQWRTEGIYMAVFIPILLFIAYKPIRNKKSAI